MVERDHVQKNDVDESMLNVVKVFYLVHVGQCDGDTVSILMGAEIPEGIYNG